MKRYLCLLICIFSCFIAACSFQKDIEDSSLNEFKTNLSSNKEIVASGKYYRIYKDSKTQVYYDIYNLNGEIVLSETTERPLTIDMLSANIVDIGIGMGTGLTVHRYYNVERNLFSQEFSYVLSNLNEFVAYIDVPKKSSFENRKLIVQNAFDRNSFYKEFQLDFSHVDTPVIQAAFSKDGSSLELTYLSEENQLQVSKILKLDE